MAADLTPRRGRQLVLGWVIAAVLLSGVGVYPRPAHADANGGDIGWQHSESGNGPYHSPANRAGGGDPVFYREWGTIGYYECGPPRKGCGAFSSVSCGYNGLPPGAPPEYGYGDYTSARADANNQANGTIIGIPARRLPATPPPRGSRRSASAGPARHHRMRTGGSSPAGGSTYFGG